MSKTRQTKIRSLTAKFSQGHQVDWHSHDWMQLVFATSGVMHVQTERSTWIVPPQRAVWIPAELSHKIVMYGAVMMRTLYLPPRMRVVSSKRCVAVNVSNLMRELIVHICKLGIVEPSCVENRSLIQLLICQAKKMESEPLMLPMPSDPRAIAAANSMLADPAQSLSEVAKESNVSLRTLQRFFTEQTQTPLGRWRRQAGLLSAVRLLEEGRTVTEISNALGFESLSAFIFSFRKFFGVTPSKYLA
ncbi:MAG: helix-turn-helix domain-containing protein [Mariniblastus sp.]